LNTLAHAYPAYLQRPQVILYEYDDTRIRVAAGAAEWSADCSRVLFLIWVL